MSGTSQLRSKISKPMMERRRRARINACVRELRALLIQARATTSCQSSKLEKAKILEFTVRHLRALHRQSTGGWSRFCAGYLACVQEISRFFRTAEPQQHRPITGHPTIRYPTSRYLTATHPTITNLIIKHLTTGHPDRTGTSSQNPCAPASLTHNTHVWRPWS